MHGVQSGRKLTLKRQGRSLCQVVDTYKKEGFAMLLKAFNDTDYLEKLTGLDELHRESEAIMDDVDWDEGSEGSF